MINLSVPGGIEEKTRSLLAFDTVHGLRTLRDGQWLCLNSKPRRRHFSTRMIAYHFQTYLGIEDVRLLTSPARSPNLSPIENI
ncbi:hypothetical protein TNCV_707141 [Trichonephila clavipes]|nr:hypothetical protein TNCV_707141 [Trichonephila clavipes]